MACLAGFLGFAIIQFGRAQDGSGLGDVRFLGGLMALVAALAWGLFSTLARKISDAYRLEARSSMFLFEVAGLAVSLPLLGLGLGPAGAPLVGQALRWGWIFSRWDLVLLLFVLGAGSSAVASMFWLRAIKLGGAGRTAIVAYLTPVASLTILGILLGQWPRWYAAAGLVLILAAVALGEMRRRQSPAQR
jgi:drug/metabolite transporter (DMT)-like permease